MTRILAIFTTIAFAAGLTVPAAPAWADYSMSVQVKNASAEDMEVKDTTGHVHSKSSSTVKPNGTAVFSVTHHDGKGTGTVTFSGGTDGSCEVEMKISYVMELSTEKCDDKKFSYQPTSSACSVTKNGSCTESECLCNFTFTSE